LILGEKLALNGARMKKIGLRGEKSYLGSLENEGKCCCVVVK